MSADQGPPLGLPRFVDAAGEGLGEGAAARGRGRGPDASAALAEDLDDPIGDDALLAVLEGQRVHL